MRVYRLAVLAAAAALMSACSLMPHGDQVKAVVDTAIDTGISDRRAYNDQKAETLLTLPCDISVGAYYRLDNAVQQEALTMLCSGRKPNQAPPALDATGGPPPPALDVAVGQ